MATREDLGLLLCLRLFLNFDSSFEASEAFFQDNSTGSKSQGEGLDSGFGSNSNQASRSEVKQLSIPTPVIPANSVEDMVEK